MRLIGTIYSLRFCGGAALNGLQDHKNDPTISLAFSAGLPVTYRTQLVMKSPSNHGVGPGIALLLGQEPLTQGPEAIGGANATTMVLR
jgi:hypothetical protein